MGKLDISWRDVAIQALLFAALIGGFAGLSLATGWPNERSGWPVVTVVALIVAALPVAAKALSFLRESEGSIDVAGFFKVDFSKPQLQQRVIRLTENLVQQGVNIDDTDPMALDEAAKKATEQAVIVVDLGDGRSWYRTRLFALAATAEVVGSPAAIVITATRGGKSQQLVGWVRPAQIVEAQNREDENYQKVWKHSMDYLRWLRANAGIANDASPSALPRHNEYEAQFRQSGDLALLRILINQMRRPDGPPAGTPALPVIEIEGDPVWLTTADIERDLEPWLVRESVDLVLDDAEQVDTMLASEYELVPATRGSTFAGVIDVNQAERALLRQLANQSAG